VPAPKKAAAEDQAIGRSRGGLSTKIHAMVDALGNPVGLFLTGGQAHDLVGADHFLPDLNADTLIADKAYNADKRVIEPLAGTGKGVVIPPKASRRVARDYDRDLYKARHLVENSLPKSSSFGPSRRATTRPSGTSWPALTWLQPSSRFIDDMP